MDNLSTARTNYQTAADQSTKVAEDIPGLLSGLKTNLNSIFTKDNPLFAARENALNTFLNIPSQTRAELLPQNQEIFAGSHLNYSPTQQESMVTANRNAALVPLAGLNSSIVSQGGNLADILANAGNIFQTRAEVAKQRATNALNAYQQEVELEKSRMAHANNGGFGDLLSFLKDYISKTQGDGTQGGTGSTFKPDQSTGMEIPGVGTVQPYTPIDPFASSPTPANAFNYPTSLNLLGTQNYGPFNQ